MSEQPQEAGVPPAPYSPDTPCPKCAGVSAAARLCTDPFTIQPAGGSRTVLLAARCWVLAGCWEHLHWVCTTCGYEWLQLPLDAPAEGFAEDLVRERRRRVQAEVERDRRWFEQRDELKRQHDAEDRKQLERVIAGPVGQRRWWQR